MNDGHKRRTVAEINRATIALEAAMAAAKSLLVPGTQQNIDCPRCKNVQALKLTKLHDRTTTGECMKCDLAWMER